MQSTQRSATNPSSTLQLAAARKRDSQVQGLKSRLRMNMTAITENYEMILSRAKVDPNDNPSELGSFAQTEQDTFEMSVRAANIVHACENLTRLVSEIKQMLILGDFRWLAQITTANAEDLRKRRAHLDRISLRLRDKLVADLYAIEEECAGGGSLFAATAVPPPTTLSSD
ncbi:surfeit locus protein 5 [Opisthorchis viverrini]|uniref:Mediator of RNA polymerase II transcription subunit 22 n=1 Tax=Opisthorchis viverrini TaxID=6198 RepID=A0A1S8WR45_OPIVI|nr:surfeit locus protein 5 [Opisthorchis viverrini]